MSIPPGRGHRPRGPPENDQFLRLEQGRGRCQMGPAEDDLPFDEEVEDDWRSSSRRTWHNVTNIGGEPMRLYAIYGPPDHEPGTVHDTRRTRRTTRTSTEGPRRARPGHRPSWGGPFAVASSAVVGGDHRCGQPPRRSGCYPHGGGAADGGRVDP
jgi:mannose-6-phosphate isomerase-like protein (cupin superfamily)